MHRPSQCPSDHPRPRRRPPEALRGPVWILLLVLALAGGCDKRRSGTKGEGASASKPQSKSAPRAALLDAPAKAARTWVPDDGSGGKYELQSPPKVYDKDNVFDLLNGGADVLIEQGLRSVLYVRMRDASQTRADYEIQVWDVSTPAKARAMLAREKAPDAKAFSAGDAAWAEKGAVLAVKGRHLVRVIAQPAGQRKPAPVEAVTRKVLATPGARW